MYISNARRDALYRECPRHPHPWDMRFLPLTTQDFFEVIDERELVVNGERIPVVTKADYEVVYASLAQQKVRDTIRARDTGRFDPNEVRSMKFVPRRYPTTGDALRRFLQGLKWKPRDTARAA